MTFRASIQVTLSHTDPEVLKAALTSLQQLLAELPKVLPAGPTFIREAAVLELYARGDRDTLDQLNALLEGYTEHLPVFSSTLYFTAPEPA